MKNIIKRIIVGFGVALCMWFFRGYVVHAASEIQGVNLNTLTSFTFVDNGNLNYANIQRPFNYYATIRLNNVPQSHLQFFEVGIDVPNDEKWKWFYIHGISNIPMSNITANIPCQNINNNYNSFSSDSQITWYPFAFKCYKSPQNKIWLQMYLNTQFIVGGSLNLDQIIHIRSAYVSTSENLELENSIKENTQIQQETFDFLNDSSTPSDSSYDFSSNNASNNVITNLISMPITLTQKMLNGFNGGCSQYVLGTIKNNQITLPCINPAQYLGVAWNIIDIIISGIFIYKLGMVLIRKFNDITNLNNNQVSEVFK